MKIIIIDHEPFSRRRGNHYFLNEFRNKGLTVEFWCVWKVFDYCKNLPYAYQEFDTGVIYFENYSSLEKEINKIDRLEYFFFVELSFTYDTRKLFALITKKKLKWGRLEYYHNPVQGYSHGYDDKSGITKANRIWEWMHSWYAIVKSIGDLKLLKFLLEDKFRVSYFKRIRTSDVSFITGTANIEPNPSKKYVLINYFDVLEYNKQRNTPRILNYPYIVFLDMYMGKHPDLEMDHEAGYLDVERYYDKLNLFFEKLEKEYGIPVVIAAHPKSDYKGEFGDRLCIIGETCNLVINSDLVLNHASLSSVFAVLSKKNMVQFYDDDFLNNAALKLFVEIAHNISNLLGTNAVNIDSQMDLNAIRLASVDEVKYQEVLNKYFLAEDGEDVSNFNTIFNEISGL